MRVRRDPVQTRAALQAWFEAQHPAEDEVQVGELGGFDQGFSGDLLTCDLTYRRGGATRSDSVVVRLEPAASAQLFLEPRFEEQYRLMEVLAGRTSVPVPRPVAFESDPAVLGARFFAMQRLQGRTGMLGADWMDALGDEGRERTWWNGLAAMAELHRLDPDAAGLAFLAQPERGADPLEQQLQYYREYFAWARAGLPHPVVDIALDWLAGHRPAVLPPTGLVWGDAKRGNQLFTDDLRCSAVLDFEMACLGPAEEDLAWWLEGEHQTAEVYGYSSPTVKETVDRYSELLGRDIADIAFYMVFAALRIAVIRIRLYEMRAGDPDRGRPDIGDRRLARVLRTWAGLPDVRV